MLSSLTSFLFNGNPVIVQHSDENVHCPDCYTKDAEDDWLLVDIGEDSQHQVKEKSGKQRSGRPLSAINVNVPIHQSVAQDGTPPPASPSQMDGSWYVTPPPCFAAGEPIFIETSPLENLLIEHPSMSVYGSRTGIAVVPRKSHVHLAGTKAPPASRDSNENQAGSTAPRPLSPVVEKVASTKAKPGSNVTTTHNRKGNVQPSAAALAEKSGLLEESRQLVETQKQQYLSDQRKMKRSLSDRYNRTKLFQSSCKHPQRRNKLRLGNSYANNNRKCC